MMFGRSHPILKVLGFELRFDLTWLILLALIVWTLSTGYFPSLYQGRPWTTYLLMGGAAAAGVIVSIVLHELAHSLVGRRLGMEIRGITLFVFGGAAEMVDEPKTPRAEFLMAAAGPAASLVLSAALFAAAALMAATRAPAEPTAVVGYLAGINLILAVFNLLPAFPLDGGRILRAAIWAYRRDIKAATRIASGVGGAFGFLLIALGIAGVLTGAVVGGMWFVLIGLFLRAVAAASYRQLLARRSLEGLLVRDLTPFDAVAAPADMPVPRLVEEYMFGRHMEVVPVVEGKRLTGVVRSRDLKSVEPARWSGLRAREVAHPVLDAAIIRPETDAAEAFARMQKAGSDRLFVLDDDGNLVGSLSGLDFEHYLRLRRELGEVFAQQGRGHASTSVPPT